MTAPTTAVRFERRNHGKGHSYWLDGVKLVGVTTVIDEALRKRALETWAAETTAKYALDHWDELAAQPPSARLDTLTRARFAERDAALLNGTQIHGYAEAVVAGQDADVPAGQVGAVQALARLMDTYKIEPVVTERPVFHQEHGWAGTPDLLCGMRDGALWLLDWKTGKRVYAEVALQLAAYSHATHYLHEDGTVREWQPPERCGAVHITSDSATLYPVDAGDDVYLTFRYAQQMWRWSERVSAGFKAAPPWPIGPALDPSAVESVP